MERDRSFGEDASGCEGFGYMTKVKNERRPSQSESAGSLFGGTLAGPAPSSMSLFGISPAQPTPDEEENDEDEPFLRDEIRQEQEAVDDTRRCKATEDEELRRAAAAKEEEEVQKMRKPVAEREEIRRRQKQQQEKEVLDRRRQEEEQAAIRRLQQQQQQKDHQEKSEENEQDECERLPHDEEEGLPQMKKSIATANSVKKFAVRPRRKFNIFQFGDVKGTNALPDAGHLKSHSKKGLSKSYREDGTLEYDGEWEDAKRHGSARSAIVGLYVVDARESRGHVCSFSLEGCMCCTVTVREITGL